MTARTEVDRAATTSARIIAAATRLFADRGFAGTSIRAVAERAGVQSATLYAHFSSKAALFEHIVLGVAAIGADVRDALHAADSSADAKVAAAAETFCRRIARSPDHARLVTVELTHVVGPAAERIRADVATAWSDVVDTVAQGTRDGVLDAVAAPPITVAAMAAVGLGAVVPIDEPGRDLDHDEIGAAHARLACRLV